ncbi:MAG: DUF1349 domain-containing protein [Planctomycetes bacterium]|nr:DUF1349 domain-containing protein [Planctomycetota bacterium]
MGKKVVHLIGILSLVGLSVPATGQIQVAETLLVDLRAQDLTYGPAPVWPNHGTLGDFTPRGAPVVQDVAGLKAVTFDGTSWFDGPTSVPGIEGRGTRTIEVWVYNPSTIGEETMVHWSHRGGPAGTNIAFNYGNHGTWGAVGHWDAPDMPWGGSVAPTPQLGKWWHLVYTYDGTTARLYANGSPAGEKAVTLNTHAGNIIRIAAQGNDSGAAPAAQFNFTGSMAEVRIHDGVLTAKQIEQNFQQGGPRKATAPNPAHGTVGLAMPLLQWTPAAIALFEDVYLGTTPELTAADLVRPRQPAMLKMYYHLLPLVAGQTYYWRVDEIAADGQVYRGDVWSFTTLPLTAFAPIPADGAKFQGLDVDLTWQPGKDAKSYDIYFGTDRAAVAAGTGGTSQGTKSAMTFDPGPLQAGTTYYWRVDVVTFAGQKNAGALWNFTTIPNIAVSDPQLVGWWKLDEGQGRTAVDWSGKGNHGQILGGARWIEGYHGGGLQLDGQDGYVSLPIGPLLATLGSATMTSWVDFSNAGGAWQRIFDFGSGTGRYIFLSPRTGTAGGMRLALTTAAGAGESLIGVPQTLPSGWHHVAAVVDGTTRSIHLYLDGALVASGGTQTLLTDIGATTQNWLGRSQYAADGFLRGSLDDFRIYSVALPQDQIPRTMRGDPALAWNPQPARGASVDIRAASGLSWSAGEKAAKHDVYFGRDAAAVNNATPSAPEYKGRQTGTSFSLAGLVEFGGGAYFWRIDEVEADGATIHKGNLWTFTVPAYLIVDEFEGYTDDEGSRVYETWIDGWTNGTGSTVGNLTAPFAERTIVHGGKQSMPMDYNNIKAPFYSETTRTFASLQNWTEYGVTDLSLWFRGNPVRYVDKGNGAFTVGAAGHDIWDTADDFRFVYKRLTGDGSVTVKVDSIVNTNAWAKGGVMIRESLEPEAMFAYMVSTPAQGVSFGWRQITNGTCGSATQAGVPTAQWVRLTRTGSAFTAQYSADGKAWTDIRNAGGQVVSTTILMSAGVYVGLCVTSHNTAATTTVEFSGAATTGSTAGSWQQVWIGDDPDRTNSTAGLYLAVEDSTGKSALLVHPDPAAATLPAWTEWKIPLSSLAGVNLVRVKKLSLGVGNRQAPVAGGAGRIYIDDIRVTTP